MDAMSRPQTEILVHITAPARVTDDAKYRALATAYYDFEPASQTPITAWLSAGSGEAEEIDHETEESARELPCGGDVPASTKDLGTIESPVLSFQSAINNLGSPRVRRLEEGAMPDSQMSWRPPPSVVQDSMPDNDFAFPQYCTPTRILSHYTSMFDSSQSDLSPVAQRQVRQQTARSSQRRGAPLALGSPSRTRSTGYSGWEEDTPNSPEPPQDGVDQMTPSQRPKEISKPSDLAPTKDGGTTLIPLSPVAGNKRLLPAAHTPTDAAEEARAMSSYPIPGRQPPPTSRAESEPPLSKRHRTMHDPEPGKPLVRSASDVGPQQAGTSTRQLFPLVPDCLEILSPPPATAQRELRPEDMITDVLARLARELNLDRRFKPQSQARELRPFERGYWLVDCSSWEPALKRSAWGFLADYLGKGAAGWGTSCRRDPDFSWIRLYCWGCAVGHMYLVLYLMSKRKVLYTGASWIGAEGGPVVVMGAKPAAA